MPVGQEAREVRGVSRAGDLSDKTVLAFGALLHDVGKVVIRGISERGTHSVLGARFIEDEVAPHNSAYADADGKRIVEQIRYHHAREMAASSLARDSLAWVTYFADNISAGMDRKNEGDETQGQRFDSTMKLRKIFNILNGHHDKNVVDHEDYNAIREQLKSNLAQIPVEWSSVNSLINLLEATTSDVPSSTDTTELADISLFDHAKTTAGIAACVYEYLRAEGVSDFKTALFDREASRRYYATPMFLIYSCDMSGIQDFIYSISGAGALKQLRARSLYLELLLEHVVDELLERLGLSRANLLYSGGGHTYLLLPNTRGVRDELGAFESELQAWFLDRYRTDLYLASALVGCSSDDLANKSRDGQRYRSLFRNLSEQLSEAKAARYDAAQIRQLNFDPDTASDYGRECSECHRSDLAVNADGKCPLCAALGKISEELVKKNVFVVSNDDTGLPLPLGRSLRMYTQDEYLVKKPKVVRIYTKNDWNTGIKLATHIWMGDYTAKTSGDRFESYATRGVTLPIADKTGSPLGIKRLGVLRADVDNLGSTFVNGLPDDKISISRTATLSRALSYFFKSKINQILEKGDYQLQIIYSGGDDLFIVGNWSDVIHAAIDIRTGLCEFVGNGTLTISAGIGMFNETYPIARMAAETGDLEDAAKLYVSPDGSSTKNAVALWSEDTVYSWDEFTGEIAPLVQELSELFDSNEKGKAFIYRMIALLRSMDDPVSAPRLAYLLARSFEDKREGDAVSRRLFTLALDTQGRRRLVTALEWYVYSTREGD